MIQKPASELQVGDVFYRETYRQPTAADWSYTVKNLQRIVLRGYFGEPLDMVQVAAESRVLGSATITLGVNEMVWCEEGVTPAAAAGEAPPEAPRRWDRPVVRRLRRRPRP